MIYLSSTTQIPDEYKPEYGYMFSANYKIGGIDNAIENGELWMMDNNNFNDNFNIDNWLDKLLKYKKHNNTCVGIPIPDKVGDALETLRLFSRYYQVVHDLGYKVSFVSQDGITPEITPWDYFDVLFVGGTDNHKLHTEAGIMIAEAKARNKWVHVGRVNSPTRIKRFWMCDSVDGTQLTAIGKGPNGQTRNERQLSDIKKISEAVKYCRNKKSGRLGTNDQHTILEVLK